VVSGGLHELGFSVDAVLDADLARPEEFYDAIWVALDGERVVGCVAMRRLGAGGADAAGEVELKRMYLLPGYRGLGWGREMLASALEWARLERVRAVRLDTGWDMVAAQRFYEAAGFRPWGDRTEIGDGASRCEKLYRLAL
jgi:GNAT superfamily N-acetyltransferase